MLKFVWKWNHTRTKISRLDRNSKYLQESKNADSISLVTLVVTSSFPTRKYFCWKRPTTNRTKWFIMFCWGIFHMKNLLWNSSKMYPEPKSKAPFQKKSKLLPLDIEAGVKIKQYYHQPLLNRACVGESSIQKCQKPARRCLLLFQARFCVILHNQIHPKMVRRQFAWFFSLHRHRNSTQWIILLGNILWLNSYSRVWPKFETKCHKMFVVRKEMSSCCEGTKWKIWTQLIQIKCSDVCYLN
jgi:hypothetical protein